MCAHWRRPNHAACAEGHTKAVDSAPQVTPARRERVCKPRAERHLPLVGSAVALFAGRPARCSSAAIRGCLTNLPLRTRPHRLQARAVEGASREAAGDRPQHARTPESKPAPAEARGKQGGRATGSQSTLPSPALPQPKHTLTDTPLA